MVLPRIIPVLLLRDKGLVKTVKFKNARYVGDPINTVKIFNEMEVDELVLVDIDVSKNNREPDFGYLKEISSECFMPLSYGGGVNSLERIKRFIQTGIEKVVVNSAAIARPGFLKEAAETFGSSTLVAALDVKKNLLGAYKVFDHLRNSLTSLDPVQYALSLQQAGAGEIFLNNVDRDGVMNGYDVAFISTITQQLSIPVIACGGCESYLDLKNVIIEGGASAAAAGSLFVFQGPHKAVLISYPSRNQMQEIFSDL